MSSIKRVVFYTILITVKIKLFQTLNVAYNSGPKLKDFEDDIYAYGEMDTDPEANWKHSNDRLHPGRTIHVGKFAEILKGTLSNQEGTRIVAIKRLKGLFHLQYIINT